MPRASSGKSSGTVSWRGLDWPRHMPMHQRHLFLWKKWREDPYSQADFLRPISEHFLEACRLLLTKEQLSIHPWFEEMAEAWTSETGVVLWGAASCGKSHFLGLAALLDFITDPLDTFSLFASTSKQMLEIRSFASVVDHLAMLKSNGFAVPFRYVKQSMTVMLDTDQDDRSAKAMIRGVAVEDGSEREARGKLIGVHLPYVRMIADELAEMKPAILAARANLAVCRDFKFVGASNPVSMFDPCGVVSEPVDGWSSLSLQSHKWRSTAGYRVMRFDAYDSPGRTDPAKFPFLPTQATIDQVIADAKGNEDAPDVWTFLRAMPPPQGLENTVLTEAEILAYKMRERDVVFSGAAVTIAGFDPAFSSGGDNPVLQLAKVGMTDTGLPVILFDKEPRYLTIAASSASPVLEQLADQAFVILDERGVALSLLGVDDSGNQSVADMCEIRRGGRVVRCNFATKPPDVAVSLSNRQSAQERYRNFASWAWFLVKEFGFFGHIRGLPDRAAEQFCQRRVSRKNGLVGLETKGELKKRTHGASPDEGDACAILVAVARLVLGMLPGSTDWDLAGSRFFAGEQSWERLAKAYNNLGSSYLTVS